MSENDTRQGLDLEVLQAGTLGQGEVANLCLGEADIVNRGRRQRAHAVGDFVLGQPKRRGRPLIDSMMGNSAAWRKSDLAIPGITFSHGWIGADQGGVHYWCDGNDGDLAGCVTLLTWRVGCRHRLLPGNSLELSYVMR